MLDIGEFIEEILSSFFNITGKIFFCLAWYVFNDIHYDFHGSSGSMHYISLFLVALFWNRITSGDLHVWF